MLVILVITVLAVLYGLAWHNEPAKQHRHGERTNR